MVGKEHIQSIEDQLKNFHALEHRLKSLEAQLERQQQGSEYIPQQESGQTNIVPLTNRNLNDVFDGPERMDGHSTDPQLTSPSDAPTTSLAESKDPTDGMGHFLFADEENRASFGPSSSIAFTSDLSQTLWSLSQNRGSFVPSQGNLTFSEFHIARVSRHSSPAPELERDMPSIYYLPADGVVTALIDKYFSDTGLLFPYLHEESFRNTYAQLKSNAVAISRTWLGLLNMVLAIATHTSTSPSSDAEARSEQAGQFYRRANSLCNDHVMNGASLEIVQYLLLVSQYRQGTKSSAQTWATHGLAVKVALQLGLHSSEALKRFPPLEREIRKRTWFGCIVLDRSLSMTLGRPASIPESYSRLELPKYYDGIEPWPRQPWQLQRCRHSTDFFCATIRLYAIIGDTIDLLYGSNLGCGDELTDYELVIRTLKLRRRIDEWYKQLPPHMPIIKAEEHQGYLGSDQLLDRLRTILALRYHNIRILIHRAVLVRLLKIINNSQTGSTPTLGTSELKDVVGSTVEYCIDSSSEIINILHAVEHGNEERRGMLGAWWFTLYYAFDAALVLFTILLLLRRTTYVTLPARCTPESLKELFTKCVEALGLLDKGNTTVKRCSQCLQKLAEVIKWTESNHPQEPVVANLELSENSQIGNLSEPFRAFSPPGSFDGFLHQDLSLFNFDFMANDRMGFPDEFGQSRPL
ncbi:unnamed protein product [Clonostachys solani]|uniref:Xylanolytic transcriptional activator regulatory domain-containing protein n=1 Tax=Clonostachys solani TaxID=160281 RepID=A0A9N9ZAZ0_9HYPO|nr:unnamed protein product [Clonostachys solani]